MKILIIINSTWNIFNFRMGLIQTLLKNGHQVATLSPDDEYTDRLKATGVEYHSVEMNARGVNPLQDLRLFSNIYKAIKVIKPDVVLSYTIKPNIYATLSCSMLGIPIISNVSGLGTVFIKKNLSSLVAFALYRLSFRKSSWVFFQNHADRKIFQVLKLVQTNRISVLPGSGVNLQKFDIDRRENKGKRFLFVGRLMGDKGLREYIAAGKRLIADDPEVTISIAGEKGYNNHSAISDTELNAWLEYSNISFLGMKDDMWSVYSKADVMVLPSYREGLSRSLIEACAMKLPLVTTDVPGCKEVVEDGKNGLLCSVRDADDLYLKMKQMHSFPEEKRLQMGDYGRRKVMGDFDEQIVIRMYEEKIRELAPKLS